MRSSRCRIAAARALAGAGIAAALLLASCGGPYTPKRVNVAGEKLALADDLFARGKFGKSAVEYRDFLATFAGDERSDYAQFRLAESLRLNEEYALAEVEYRILINDYGYSQYVDDAFYLEAVSALEQAPRIERDQTKTYVALDRIKRFLEIFPQSDRADEARATLREIHDRIGEKEFLNARLYFSRKVYSAALVYLEKIIDNYPETVWAARSRYYRGFIRELKGDMPEAAEDYRAVIAAAGDVPERGSARSRLNGIAPYLGGASTNGGAN